MVAPKKFGTKIQISLYVVHIKTSSLAERRDKAK